MGEMSDILLDWEKDITTQGQAEIHIVGLEGDTQCRARRKYILQSWKSTYFVELEDTHSRVERTHTLKGWKITHIVGLG